MFDDHQVRPHADGRGLGALPGRGAEERASPAQGQIVAGDPRKGLAGEGFPRPYMVLFARVEQRYQRAAVNDAVFDSCCR